MGSGGCERWVVENGGGDDYDDCDDRERCQNTTSPGIATRDRPVKPAPTRPTRQGLDFPG